jgi:hypothetical protein
MGDNGRATRSGQVRLRMPVSLHEAVARSASAERVSMNQFICSALAAAVQWRPGDQPNTADPPNGVPPPRIPDDEFWEMW